jgi:sulfur carrier protein
MNPVRSRAKLRVAKTSNGVNVKINGKVESVGGALTLADLIKEKGLTAKRIVVEHNYRVVSKEEWPNVRMRESDNLEIVSFVGGG